MMYKILYVVDYSDIPLLLLNYSQIPSTALEHLPYYKYNRKFSGSHNVMNYLMRA
jgi:hypothetical protein